jgi:uncharacterized DUF497 family protein
LAVDFEWDPAKAAANRRKHGVSFADAVGVFEDDRALTLEDQHPEEERWVTIGRDPLGRVLVVSYCWRENRIRLISARKAARREVRSYEE